MTEFVRRVIAALTLAAFAGVAHAGQSDEPRVNFDRDIRPILSNNCFKCHGPDEAKRVAGLRLDTMEGERAAAKSGRRAVVPGKSAESELIRRITADDPMERMPPPSTGKVLSDEQLELFKRWIDEGAEWRPHWSFVPLKRPQPPAVRNESWVRNPIDRFVFARLDGAGLQPSPPADKTALIRRLTYDLTGLPPTPAEVDAFVANAAPDAYERLVERLLQSPRYGEHMARYWLDAVRYGDSHGLHFDNERSLWPYRDWVIDAFNRNLPFDRFTVEQVAGDLLPNPSREQLIATGFNRCNVTTSEGGSINEEVLVRYAVDRTEAVSTVFLGLTLGCAVCHEHKFDPITQKEFYQLYAFYNSAADNAMDGNALLPPPVMKLPTPNQEARLKVLDEQIALGRRNISEKLARIDYVDPATAGAAIAAAPNAGGGGSNSAADEAQPNSTQAIEPKEFIWIDDELPRGAKPQGDTPWKFAAKTEGQVLSGEKASTRTAPGLSQHFFTEANPGLRIGDGDKLFAYCYLDPANPPKTVMLQFNDGNWEHRAFWGEDLIAFGAGDAPGHRPMGPLPETGKWIRLEVDVAKVGLGSGSVLNGWAFTQHGGTVWWDKAGIVTRTPQGDSGFESLAAWDAYERGQSKSTLPQPVQGAVKTDPSKRNDEQKKQIREYFLENVNPKTKPIFEPLKAQLELVNKERAALDATIPSTMVMADMPQPRETFILIRGAYNKKGDKVNAGVPAVLTSMPKDAPPNRLGLAQWLTDPSHPLTARVTVNRFWQQFFGRGFVATANDFGSQGDWPSHPELLDWLSAEFIQPLAPASGERGRGEGSSDAPTPWDIKHLVRLIVCSNTYRQSSRVTPDLAKRDPENKLLARGPRFRMDAEVVRDMALAASGLLADKIGGRSVKPYQPPGLWEAVGFLGSNTREYKPDSGDGLYRRSLYTFWKRTSPPAALMTFDAPSRETCTVRRPRTNTPLQALALMNDEQYVEASRQLARRMMTEAGSIPHDRLAHGFRLCAARRPQSRELDVLVKLYEQQLAHYQTDRDAAVKLLSIGESKRDESLDPSEHAAWTMMANLLLNLDETITKE
jgi:hypothetical protein